MAEVFILDKLKPTIALTREFLRPPYAMHSMHASLYHICSPVAKVFLRSSTEFIYRSQGAEHYHRVAKQGHRMDVTVPEF